MFGESAEVPEPVEGIFILMEMHDPVPELAEGINFMDKVGAD